MSSSEKIMVSVICITYNHGRFVRQALEGFVNQKTNFSYEVLIHDDASTDNTAEIIKEYEKKYPEIIKPIYQTENQYSKGIAIIKNYIHPRARGKYIAYCEGDDFWIDPSKLQKQVDAMEKNPSCTICFNKVALTGIDGKKNGSTYPAENELTEGFITAKDYLSFIVYPGPVRILPIQFSGCMVKNDALKLFYTEQPEYTKGFPGADIPLFLYMGTKGDAYYINEEMSCYRTGNGESWVGRIRKNKSQQIENYKNVIKALREFDSYSNYIVHNAIEKGIRNREFAILKVTHDFKGMRKKEMREQYRALKIKVRLREFFFAYVPGAEKLNNAIRRKT